MTSHAAVVARGMGTCCVSGCGAISIDEEAKQFTLGGYTFTEGIIYHLMVQQVRYTKAILRQWKLL